MGQVTIFEKANCRYCVRVYEVLERLIKEVLADINASNPELPPKIDIKRVDCGADGALAALCIRLTGTFTVPHIFFNEEYLGDCKQCCCLDSNSKEGCNILYSKLKSLAMKPSPDPPFPPSPNAAIIKVTDSIAISSQPTLKQLAAMKVFQISTVLNILRPDSPAFQKIEEAIVQSCGVNYKHAPIYVVTCDTVMQVVNMLKDLPTPILIHDDAGQRAGLVVLLWAAQRKMHLENITLETVLKWARDLGLDLTTYSLVIGKCLAKMRQDLNESKTIQ